MIVDDLTILAIVVPLIGGFLTPLMGMLGRKVGSPKVRDYFALLVSIVTVVFMFYIGKAVIGQGQMLTYSLAGRLAPWGINLAVDGFAFLAGLVGSSVTLVAVVYSLGFMEQGHGLDKYYLLLLILSAGMIGVSFTGDIFNLYVFFEIMSLTSYGLVAYYRDGKALEGAFKYLVIGALGTVAILLGIGVLYGMVGTLNIADLSVRLGAIQAASGFTSPMMFALGLFIAGFGIKIGMIPLHVWLPDAYQAAPSSITAAFAGGTAVVGVYALLRSTFMLFGAVDMSTIFVFLGFVSMIVGAFMALVQTDLKRLLAYSGVSQMGYILVGVGVGGLGAGLIGVEGGLFHMLNNAIYKSLLFLCAGVIVYKVGTTDMDKLGGLSSEMPVTTLTFLIGALAIAGIPFFNGFASKLQIYFATLQVNPLFTIISVVISALTLAYFLKALGEVFLGQPTEEVKESIAESKSIPKKMLIPMVFLAFLCVLLGVLPQLGLEIVEPASEALLSRVEYVEEVLHAAI